MKQFTSIYGILLLVVYAFISFISLQPNPATWGSSGRAAFLVFTAIVAIVVTVVVEGLKKENK
jgi:hypothetical protein